MDQARVIRVDIDPTFIHAEETSSPRIKGFLHEELKEFKQALAQEGGLMAFSMPDWFHKAKTAIVKNTPPASETTLFHEKVTADLTEMLKLLDSMATMMAAWKPPGTAGRPTNPAPLNVGDKDEEILFLIESQ